MTAPTIVAGVDGSPTSEDALRWAAALARVLGAEVVAVHAVGLIESAHDVAASAWSAPLLDSGVAHRIDIEDGDAVEVLLRAAEREHAALLVVGSRGTGTRPELAIGSTSLRLLQAGRIPALVVPDGTGGPDDRGRIRLHHVLVGVDGSGPALAALAVAADLVDSLGGSLSVVEAFDYDPPFPLGPAAATTSPGEEQALQTTAARLEEQVRDIRGRGVHVQVIVRSGDACSTLLDVADDIAADLIVVGSRGQGDPADPLLGSVARAVAARAARPTLVVPAAAGAVHLAADAAHDRHSRPREVRWASSTVGRGSST